MRTIVTPVARFGNGLVPGNTVKARVGSVGHEDIETAVIRLDPQKPTGFGIALREKPPKK